MLKLTRKEIYKYIRKNIGSISKEKQKEISTLIKSYSKQHNYVLLEEVNMLYKKLEEKNNLIKQYEAKQKLFQPEIKRDLIIE